MNTIAGGRRVSTLMQLTATDPDLLSWVALRLKESGGVELALYTVVLLAYRFQGRAVDLRDSSKVKN